MRRPASTRASIRGRAVLLGCGVAVACSRPAAPVDATSEACPAGFAPDRERAEQLARGLADAPEAADLLPHARALTLCFGAVEHAVVTPGGLALLDAGLPEVDAIARLAHLAHHRAHPVPVARGRVDCVARALDRERDAWLIELAIRRRHAAAGRPPAHAYSIESEKYDPKDWQERVRAWLAAEAPDSGAPRLRSHYQRLCGSAPPTG